MSEKVFRSKLRVLLKRQIRREAKFQKALMELESSIKKYVENNLKRENLFKLIEDARRVSFFHVDALRDIISNLHSPQFMRVRFGSMRPTELGNSVTMEAGLNPQKVR